MEKDFITEEECRRVSGAGRFWYDKLGCTIAVKPPGVVEMVIDVLEEYKKEVLYSWTANRIKGEHTVLHWNSM
ncbi:MAG: hypothetical protein MPL62_16820 [Alphaproteobacteria bacterium]|nr:hypothetical protein [Alphaproteobacteria bacterium]